MSSKTLWHSHSCVPRAAKLRDARRPPKPRGLAVLARTLGQVGGRSSPIFNNQARHARKLFAVAGYQSGPKAERLGCDERIERTEQCLREGSAPWRKRPPCGGRAGIRRTAQPSRTEGVHSGLEAAGVARSRCSTRYTNNSQTLDSKMRVFWGNSRDQTNGPVDCTHRQTNCFLAGLRFACNLSTQSALRLAVIVCRENRQDVRIWTVTY
jgi:hypothetical protein